MNSKDIEIKNILDLSKTNYSFLFNNLKYPFEVLPLISKKFDDCIRSLDMREYNRIKQNVFVHKSVTVLKSVYLGNNIIIGKDVDLRNNAFLRENIIIGDNCVVGNVCELKNILMFNHSKAPHFNYLGDSVLGYNAHISAGVINSNLKLDETTVKLKLDDGILDTHLRKFGAIIGDNAQVGCNSVLNPGTIIGRNSLIYPLQSVRNVVESNVIYKNESDIAKKN